MFKLPLVRVALHIFHIKRLIAWSECEIAQPQREGLISAAKLEYLINIAATRGPIRTNCFPRALIFCRTLRQNGHAAELKLGVNSSLEKLQAHAWVELEGHSYLSSKLDHYAFADLHSGESISNR